MPFRRVPPDLGPPIGRAAWVYAPPDPDAKLVRIWDASDVRGKFMPFVVTRYWFETYTETSEMADLINDAVGMDWGYISNYQGDGDEWGENRYVIHYWKFEPEVSFADAVDRIQTQAKKNGLGILVETWGFSLPDRVTPIEAGDGVSVQTFPKTRYRLLEFGNQEIDCGTPPGLIEI